MNRLFVYETHCEFRLRNGRGKTCLWKNLYWSTCIGKSKERKIFDFLHCPFEPPAKQHRPVSQLGWILWCMLARPSKGQCRNSKFFPPLPLTVKVDQIIFFPETCFASTISEREFTVWGRSAAELNWTKNPPITIRCHQFYQIAHYKYLQSLYRFYLRSFSHCTLTALWHNFKL